MAPLLTRFKSYRLLFWGYLEVKCYVDNPRTVEELKKAIRNAVNTIDDKFNFNRFSTVSASDSNLVPSAKVNILKIYIEPHKLYLIKRHTNISCFV